MRRDVWSAELITFCRCACLTAPELDSLEAEKAQPVTRPPRDGTPADMPRRRCSGGSAGGCNLVPLAASAEAKDNAREGKIGCVPRCSEEEAIRSQGKSGSSGGGGGGGGGDIGLEVGSAVAHPPLSAFGEVVPPDTGSDSPSLQGSPTAKPKQDLIVQDTRQRNGGKGGVEDGAERTKHEEGETGEGGGGGGAHDAAPEAASCSLDKPWSVRNELAALAKAVHFLVQARDGFPTTLEHDEARTADRRGV